MRQWKDNSQTEWIAIIVLLLLLRKSKKFGENPLQALTRIESIHKTFVISLLGRKSKAHIPGVDISTSNTSACKR